MKPTNPPAFPVPELPGGHKVDEQGLSMRDYFAAAALCGYIALPGGCPTPEDAARAAYQHADAMLAARTAPGVRS